MPLKKKMVLVVLGFNFLCDPLSNWICVLWMHIEPQVIRSESIFSFLFSFFHIFKRIKLNGERMALLSQLIVVAKGQRWQQRVVE